MRVHITKTYNIGGLIGLRQNAVKNAGETLGFKEMSLFKFPDAYDSDDELHVRMDGIIASLCPEDIVIFQHPSGESPRYDGFLFEHLRRYHGTKIVAFIQEIASDRDDSEYSLSDEITLLNRADMFIFASATLRDYYIANGLKEKHYRIQNIPDYMTDICANEHKNKKLYIMAETSQNEYPLNNLNIEVVQYDEYHVTESILRLSDGGFGLIWDTDEQALGLYMAAGIPIIVKKGLSCEKYVIDNEIGAAATDFEDVYRMPQMHFHVAAITEMSSKLMSAGQYDNVSLYPNVKMSVLDSLFEKCDFYLDINHEGEIVDAVHRAFLNNMLIVGYEETMHNAYYTADTNTFKESEYANMAEALNLTLAMPHLIDEALAMQKKAAVAADATDYMEILHL